MDDLLVRRVKSNLEALNYVMHDSWLNECVEYYTSEHNESTVREVEEFVISQWQLSDLREIHNGNGCLPMGLAAQKSTVLPGKYILQMEKMYDISTSKYSQLEKIRKVSNVNLEATDVNKPQAWEPQGRRMMQLYLTDGVQEVTAIEYKPIKFLKSTLLPGYKVMIIGPVECRRGVIMLEEKNFREIGGEVETLLKPNALENVLARALDVQENPDPYNDNDQQNANKEIQNAFLEDEFEINFDELTQIERQSQENANSVQRINTDNGANNRGIANSNTVKTSVQNSNVSGNRNRKKSETSNSVTSYFQNKPREETLNEFPDDDDGWLAVIDENKINSAMGTNMSSTKSIVNPKNTGSFPNPLIVQPKESEFPESDDDLIVTEGFEDIEMENSLQSKPGIEKNCNKPSTSGNEFKIASSTLQRGKHPIAQTAQGKKLVVQNQQLTFHKPTNDLPEIPDDDFDFANAVPIDTHKITDNKSTTSNISRLSIHNSPEGSSKTSKLNVKTIPARPSTSGSKRPAADSTPPLNNRKMKCIQETPKLSKPNRKITEFTEKVLPKEEPPQKICDFICDVITERVTGPPIYKTVRGKVTKLNKLSKKENNWFLEGTITDGTASLDITFATAILENLFGFTVAQFSEKKKLRKVDPTIEDQIRTTFRTAERKLNNLDALMELELSENKKPNVITIQKLTDELKELIQKRIKMLAI